MHMDDIGCCCTGRHYSDKLYMHTVHVYLVHGNVCLPRGSKEAQAIHPACNNTSLLSMAKALHRQIIVPSSTGGFKLLHTTSATE